MKKISILGKSIAIIDVILGALVTAFLVYLLVAAPFLFDLVLFAFIPIILFMLGLSFYIKNSILINDERKRKDAKDGIKIFVVFALIFLLRASFTKLFETFRFVEGTPDNAYVYYGMACGGVILLLLVAPLILSDVISTRKKLKSKN